MEKLFNRMISTGGFMSFAGFFAYQFCFIVDGGHRALIFDKTRGVLPEVYGEGIHFRIPVIQNIRTFEIRAKPQQITTKSGTRDLQEATMTLRILYRPVEQQLPVILNNLGAQYDSTVIPSILNEVMKATIAQYDASQLITQREKVSSEIKSQLQNRAQEFNIILDDVAITHLEYTHQFTKSIEEKQIQHQRALRQQHIVAINEQEARIKVMMSEAQAKSAKLLADSVKVHGNGILTLRKIEAAQHIAENLRNSPNATFLSGNTMNMINLGHRM